MQAHTHSRSPLICTKVGQPEVDSLRWWSKMLYSCLVQQQVWGHPTWKETSVSVNQSLFTVKHTSTHRNLMWIQAWGFYYLECLFMFMHIVMSSLQTLCRNPKRSPLIFIKAHFCTTGESVVFVSPFCRLMVTFLTTNKPNIDTRGSSFSITFIQRQSTLTQGWNSSQ